MNDETPNRTPFRSDAEMVAAMQDPRYSKDEAYREDVAVRIATRDSTSTPTAPATPYRSSAEMVRAIQDPRYAKDEAYRADVAAKITATQPAQGTLASSTHDPQAQPTGDAFLTTASQAVGGAERLGAVREWVRTHGTSDEIARWNAAVDAGNVAEIQDAARRFSASPADPWATALQEQRRQLRTENMPALGGGFASDAEMMRAIQDPRYAKDEAYRDDVYAKIARMKGLA